MISGKRNVIKNRIKYLIDNEGIDIDLKRKVKTKVGRDSYEESEIPVKTIKGILNTNNSTIESITDDFGNIIRIKKINLNVLLDETFTIKKDDYFTLNNLKHQIIYPNNIKDIYWKCDVVVLLND